jgi:hypothetical protein
MAQQIFCAVEPWLPTTAVLRSNHDQDGRFRLGGCVDERGVRRGWISGFTAITAITASQRPPNIGCTFTAHRPPSNGCTFVNGFTYVLSHPDLRRTTVRRDDLHGP